MRYTLATGEPVFTGFMRTQPGARVLGVAVRGDVPPTGRLAVFGRAVGRRDVSFSPRRRIATPADATTIYQLGVGTFLLCILLLMLGRRIERTLELLNWVMVVCILGGFLVLGLYFVPASYVGRRGASVFRVRSAASDVQLHAGQRRTSFCWRRWRDIPAPAAW